MDANRFNRLVKAAMPGSRRSAFGFVGGVLGGIAVGGARENAVAHKKRKPKPDLCRNPIDPVACQATGGCAGCVTAAGNLCRINPCVPTDVSFACMRTAEGTNVCVRQPSGTSCANFRRCRKSKSCGKGHVCGFSCCNGGEFRCFPRCSATAATGIAAANVRGDGRSPMP